MMHVIIILHIKIMHSRLRLILQLFSCRAADPSPAQTRSHRSTPTCTHICTRAKIRSVFVQFCKRFGQGYSATAEGAPADESSCIPLNKKGGHEGRLCESGTGLAQLKKKRTPKVVVKLVVLKRPILPLPLSISASGPTTIFASAVRARGLMMK